VSPATLIRIQHDSFSPYLRIAASALTIDGPCGNRRTRYEP
jgi:hypothetical protein